MKTFLIVLASLLLLFNGVGALYGGWSFIAHPDGSGLQMSLDWLKHTPFHNYFIPGIILFIANGIFSIVTFVFLIFKNTKSSGFVVSQGIILVGWISVQMVLIQTVHLFHIVCALIGLALMSIGFALKRYSTP